MFYIDSWAKKLLDYSSYILIFFLTLYTVNIFTSKFMDYNYKIGEQKRKEAEYKSIINSLSKQKTEIKDFMNFLNKLDCNLLSYEYNPSKGSKATVLCRITPGYKIVSKYAIKQITDYTFENEVYCMLEISEGR